MTINGKTFEIDADFQIADKTYRVWNVQHNFDLVNFGKVGKRGQMLSSAPHNQMVLTFERIAELIDLGVIV